jgi:outer membrane protein OmpA-like peptidoglycan-associated protein
MSLLSFQNRRHRPVRRARADGLFPRHDGRRRRERGGGSTARPPTRRSPAYFNTVVGDRVLFAVDQSTLSPAAMATLDSQAAG